MVVTAIPPEFSMEFCRVDSRPQRAEMPAAQQLMVAHASNSSTQRQTRTCYCCPTPHNSWHRQPSSHSWTQTGMATSASTSSTQPRWNLLCLLMQRLGGPDCCQVADGQHKAGQSNIGLIGCQWAERRVSQLPRARINLYWLW